MKTQMAVLASLAAWFLAVDAATAREITPNVPRSLSDDTALVGHSLVNHDMPRILRRFMADLGATGTISHQVINGAGLEWNWENATTAEGTNVRALLEAGGTEALVLTESGPIENHYWSGSYTGGMPLWYSHAAANGVEQVFFYQIWPGLDSPGINGSWTAWRAQIDAERYRFEDIADSQADVLIVPGGNALAALYDAVQVGTVPGMTDTAAFQAQVFADDIHLTALGNYFIACVQFATVHRRSPIGFTNVVLGDYGEAFVDIERAKARRLQEIAWETVTNYSRTGVDGS